MNKDGKEDLFGSVSARRTGTHVVNPRHLMEPFEGPGENGGPSVAYLFCRGCGLVGEINEKIGQRLAQKAGTPFDGPVPRGIYFETDGCPFCGDRQTNEIEVKAVPESAETEGTG